MGMALGLAELDFVSSFPTFGLGIAREIDGIGRLIELALVRDFEGQFGLARIVMLAPGNMGHLFL